MLFDLRGKGRRRTVRVLYIGLALLMGVGLVGFGIGGGFGGGGLLNAASNNEGSNAASFASQIKKYSKVVQRQPSNLEAWQKLTEAELHEAGGEAYVSSTGVVTSKGKELFSRAAQSWRSYLALNPPQPSAKLAQLVLPIYAPGGLNQPAEAVQVLQIVVAAKPNSASRYAELAEYAYKAKNIRVADLAAAKAVALAPAAQRVRLKKELEEVKKNPSGEKVYTTTTNGKTYTGKLNSKGELQATQVTSSTPATTTTSSTKK
jgi:tetratricopeptide (TPR) repeat protein